MTSQACKSGCLVPKWLKHWTTDLKVLVLAPLGNRCSFLALQSALTNECMYSLRHPSSEMYTKPLFPGYLLG